METEKQLEVLKLKQVLQQLTDLKGLVMSNRSHFH